MFKSVYINSTETTSFEAQLNQPVESESPKRHLIVNKMLTGDDLAQLEVFANTHSSFPFSKLTLKVDSHIIQDSRFLNIIKKLNASSFLGMELVFAESELAASAKPLEEFLTNIIASLVTYPVQIRKQNKDGLVSPTDLALATFQEKVIARIQEKNKQPVVVDASHAEDEPRSTTKRLDLNNPLSKPIRLKELIAIKKLQGKDKDKYVQLEVQHVEMVDHEVAHEEVLDYEVEAELQEIQSYSGKLLGYKEFTEDLSYQKTVESVNDPAAGVKGRVLRIAFFKSLKKELFANVPHAIKYVSPEAAEQLILDLPGLVTLNKENLPQGFLLKKTAQGELVLDFDPYLEHEKINMI